MDIGMLMIVLVIVIPGYFLVRRLSTTLYSDNQKMEAETERRYGFQRLENERIEKAKLTKINEVRSNSKPYQRIPRRIVWAPQKTDMTVVKEYRRRVTDEKLNKVNIKQK
ncbi:hypothetical protein [Acetobacterium sp. UBA5834]|jgi:hypothetical protein|uniref:hypothetical protein n=1 Tax=Acetobacterium sp. UBA5834 TaxID=1945907 RepID=UPI00257EFC8E|nr:hypothetical protein [Acetobacterium sp. UBA5834]